MLKIPSYKDISTASKQVATSSVLNPLMWISVCCFPVALICSVIAKPPLSYIILGLGGLPIGGCLWGFQYFARRDPKRLQSEKHIENMELIGRMQGYSDGEVITIESKPVLSNPSSIGVRDE